MCFSCGQKRPANRATEYTRRYALLEYKQSSKCDWCGEDKKIPKTTITVDGQPVTVHTGECEQKAKELAA